MPSERAAWRMAALPALAVLGIALPLAFASHCGQYLYDFRSVDLVPLYATAWLMLALAVLPAWLLLAVALRALETAHRPPGPLMLRLLRAAVRALTAGIVVATLIHCLSTWLGTFGRSLPVSADEALALEIAIAAIAAGTVQGRAALAALAPLAAICAALGALTLATLPAYGWPRGMTRIAASLTSSAASAPRAPGSGARLVGLQGPGRSIP